jgi:hypothetical protein
MNPETTTTLERPTAHAGLLRRAALALVRASDRLHAYRPAWPPAWLASLADYLTTALAGALDTLAAVLVVVA